MRSYVIGASGVIGSETLQLLRENSVSSVGTYSTHSEPGLTYFDMRLESIKKLAPELGPSDVVYLLAAYSNPSWIFAHPTEAKELNLDATKKLAQDVVDRGARLVFMSSVEVFDGQEADYTESSRPNPLNLYGRMKVEIEEFLKSLQARTCIVRTGWNIGWSQRGRCVVALTYHSLLSQDPRMAIENTFSVVDVRDTARGLYALSKSELPYCHIASPGTISRIGLADLIIANSSRGHLMKYRPVEFSEIPYSEPRAKKNHLNVRLSERELGMVYRKPEEVILEKIRYLDQLPLESLGR